MSDLLRKIHYFARISFSNKNLRGFTLVEMLIVVVIIGLLASLIVLAVGNARIKAGDGSIEANLTQVRQIAALIQSESGSYVFSGNALCDTSGTLNDGNVGHPQLKSIEDEVKKRNGQQNVVCMADINRYCVQSPLVSSGTLCVDYKGRVAKSSCNSGTMQCL